MNGIRIKNSYVFNDLLNGASFKAEMCICKYSFQQFNNNYIQKYTFFFKQSGSLMKNR